jgi:hypothetical protein
MAMVLLTPRSAAVISTCQPVELVGGLVVIPSAATLMVAPFSVDCRGLVLERLDLKL